MDVDGGQFGVQAAFELREDVQQDDGIEPAAEGGFDAAGAADGFGQGAEDGGGDGVHGFGFRGGLAGGCSRLYP